MRGDFGGDDGGVGEDGDDGGGGGLDEGSAVAAPPLSAGTAVAPTLLITQKAESNLSRSRPLGSATFFGCEYLA